MSTYTLTAIAVDRYMAICHPLKFHVRASRTIITIIAVWLVSFIIMIPQAVFLTIEKDQTLQKMLEIFEKPLWLSKCYEVGNIHFWFLMRNMMMMMIMLKCTAG